MAVKIKPPEANTEFSLANWSYNLDASRVDPWHEDMGLFHYTDIGGLWGILSSSQIWATHTYYLNDSSEIEFGLSWINELLKNGEKEAAKLVDKEADEEWASTAYVLHKLYQFVGAAALTSRDTLLRDSAPFVSCLSCASDSLTQWQAYGNRGGGYSIQFDGQAFEDSIQQVDESGGMLTDQPTITAALVEYQTWNLQKRVDEAVNDFLQGTRAGKEGDLTYDQSPSLRAFLRRLVEISMLLKHQSFWPERERRICISGGAETFYSQSALGLVPRMRIGFDPKSVREVMVGPGPHEEARKYSIERFLAGQPDLSHVAVTTSEVPYRAP
ncbi:DUF2971 domain-containing protein [Tsukamurella sp. 8F]|uniref:DUF2971 domain-containing protein n=1 Tax=unclassified Tsukamurella TaxID=2633480 RepID=UPI0023B904D2|nr:MULTISPECIES: DUF2971 domain-containing protein [unclassified Tsukamurella]MDF0529581.1 DUF2971 domain-containing protein [Tsukamurella sp. 8J]MDF0585731.1 DUF2971 domain-containing protein [Tsukamurella sp. 8F]